MKLSMPIPMRPWPLFKEVPGLIQRLESVWQVMASKGIDRGLLIRSSMLSPATCCLVNPDKEKTKVKSNDAHWGF
jgi:hypothetical protein